MYVKRQIEGQLSYLSKHFPVVIITGARQTGKSTLVKECIQDATYITLDHPYLRQLAKSDPELFLQQYEGPVIIDEIQYAPELLPFIKIRIDNNREPGQYFLTGSQMFRLMKGASESLAGRAGLLKLYGFSRSEIYGKPESPFLPSNTLEPKSSESLVTIFDRILKGSMPQIVTDNELTPEAYFGEYMQTYLERDIRDLLAVKNESKFLQFIRCAAARTAQELNLLDIANDVGIDSKTADSWMSMLISSGLVYLLNAYSTNTIKRVVKRPKMYFMDTGLACYLSLWNNPQALSQSAMAGPMFETYVVSEIIKQYSNAGLETRSRLAYYRDNNGKEIDLLIIENGKIYPIEIKKSANPGTDALKNFTVLSSLQEETAPGAVICLASNEYPLDRMNKVVPVSML